MSWACICVPFPFQNKENWKCLLTSTNVSALCSDFNWRQFNPTSTIRALSSRSSWEMKFDSSSWYVKAGLLRFCQDHVRVFLDTTHLVKTRVHSPRPTKKINAMIALRRDIWWRQTLRWASWHVACSAVAQAQCKKKRRLFLGPVSAVGEKAKNRVKQEKYRWAKRALVVAWGGGRSFPSPDYFSARFARRFFSPISLTAEPGPMLTCSLYLENTKDVVESLGRTMNNWSQIYSVVFYKIIGEERFWTSFVAIFQSMSDLEFRNSLHQIRDWY